MKMSLHLRQHLFAFVACLYLVDGMGVTISTLSRNNLPSVALPGFVLVKTNQTGTIACNLTVPAVDNSNCILCEDFIAEQWGYTADGKLGLLAIGDPFSEWVGDPSYINRTDHLFVARGSAWPFWSNTSKYLGYEKGYGQLHVNLLVNKTANLGPNCKDGRQCASRVDSWPKPGGPILDSIPGTVKGTDFIVIFSVCWFDQGRIECGDYAWSDPFSSWWGDDSFALQDNLTLVISPGNSSSYLKMTQL